MPTDLASVSRPQKTLSPTFQMPFCRTEVPFWPLATVVPAAERSYFTVAWVDEVSVTESTLDVTAAAMGLAAKEVIAEENSEPFCSNCTRSLFGVEELKNLFQLVVISETALAVPPLAAGLDEADEAGVLGAAGAEDEEELEPLEQADIAVMSTRPSAGAR